MDRYLHIKEYVDTQIDNEKVADIVTAIIDNALQDIITLVREAYTWGYIESGEDR